MDREMIIWGNNPKFDGDLVRHMRHSYQYSLPDNKTYIDSIVACRAKPEYSMDSRSRFSCYTAYDLKNRKSAICVFQLHISIIAPKPFSHNALSGTMESAMVCTHAMHFLGHVGQPTIIFQDAHDAMAALSEMMGIRAYNMLNDGDAVFPITPDAVHTQPSLADHLWHPDDIAAVSHISDAQNAGML